MTQQRVEKLVRDCERRDCTLVEVRRKRRHQHVDCTLTDRESRSSREDIDRALLLRSRERLERRRKTVRELHAKTFVQILDDGTEQRAVVETDPILREVGLRARWVIKLGDRQLMKPAITRLRR